MNRTLLNIVKSPITLFFIGGFILPFMVCVLKDMVFYPLKTNCVVPQARYDISDDKNWTLTRGIYRFYRDGLTLRRVVYTGSISHYINGGRQLYPVAVLREITVSSSVSKNQLINTIIHQSSRLGDQSNNDEVVKYVFPHIIPGETSTNRIYLLDGKALAVSGENSAPTLCVN